MTKLKLRVERTFQSHTAGDVFLAEETPEIAAYVRSRLLSVIAVETTGESQPEPEPTPEPEPAPEPPAAAPKPAAKPKAKSKAKAKTKAGS